MTPALFKGLLAMGMIALASVFTGFDDLKSLIEVAIMVAGMIGVAAVMRSDVNELKAWRVLHDKEENEYKQAHNSAHSQIATALTTLSTLMTENQRRLSNLEDGAPYRHPRGQ